MRKILVFAAVAAGLIVAYNLHARPLPHMELEQVFPALEGWGWVSGTLSFALAPGLYALWYLGMEPESAGKIAAMALFSLWAWGAMIRTPYAVVGRYFGFYNPNHFRYFLWLPWRPLWKLALKPLRWREEMFKHGVQATGGWSPIWQRLSEPLEPGAIFGGTLRGGGIGLLQPVGIKGDRHIVIIAGSGAGKTSHAITTLTLEEGNLFAIDSKGTMARTTARRMGEGGNGIIGKGMNVRVLDPFLMVGERLGWWDPFAQMEKLIARKGADMAPLYAVKMAEGFIVRYAQENPFFPGSAKDFLVGLILYVYLVAPPEARSIVTLFDWLCNGRPELAAPGKSAFGAMLRHMSEVTAFNGIIAASANALADAGENTYGSVLITIREQLKWLKLPQMRAICQPSPERKEVNLEELVVGFLALYVCLAVTDIRGPLSGWCRLLSVLALYAFEEMQKHLRCPTRFLLDEFPSLGRIESIEIAAPVMRSMGVRLCVIAQDIAQLRDVYPNTWEGFIGNAEVCELMGGNHQETLLYGERAIGTCLVRRKVDGGWPSKAPARHEHRNEPLMYAEQIKRFLGQGNMILLRPDMRPSKTKRAPYFKYAPVYFYEADRDHREMWQRRLTRKVCQLLLPDGRKAAAPEPFSERAEAQS